MNHQPHHFRYYLWILFLLLGCTTNHSKNSLNNAPIAIAPHEKVFVISFVNGRDANDKLKSLNTLLNDLLPDKDVEKNKGAQHLTEAVHHQLQNKLGDHIRSDTHTLHAATLKLENNHTLLDLAINIGTQFEASYVVTGNVWRYQKRIGLNYSVEKPASVGFVIYLIHIPSKRVIWQAVFDQTQPALSENLFGLMDFIEHRGKWLTVNDYAQFAVKKSLKNFPILLEH